MTDEQTLNVSETAKTEDDKPYKGSETTHHPAHFNDNFFRMATADEIEKLKSESKRTRHAKYPFASMKVGEEWKIPFGHVIASVRTAADSYGRRHGRLYVVRKTPTGNMTVIRLE